MIGCEPIGLLRYLASWMFNILCASLASGQPSPSTLYRINHIADYNLVQLLPGRNERLDRCLRRDLWAIPKRRADEAELCAVKLRRPSMASRESDSSFHLIGRRRKSRNRRKELKPR